jgi:hypothetical protein
LGEEVKRKRKRHDWCILKHTLEASESARELVSDAVDDAEADFAAKVAEWLGKLDAVCLDLCAKCKYGARAAEVLRGLLHAERHARERAGLAHDDQERAAYLELLKTLRSLRKEFLALLEGGA